MYQQYGFLGDKVHNRPTKLLTDAREKEMADPVIIHCCHCVAQQLAVSHPQDRRELCIGVPGKAPKAAASLPPCRKHRS